MSEPKPREYTLEETRDILLKRIHRLVDYWEGETRATTSKEKLEGLAFSFCSLLDGDHDGLPGFVVSPNPHPSDREYHRDKGENWFPEGGDLGCLHEFFHTPGE